MTEGQGRGDQTSSQHREGLSAALKQYDITLIDRPGSQDSPKDLISAIREAKAYDRDVHSGKIGRSPVQPNFDLIGKRITSIGRRNQVIEDAVNLEVIGVQHGLIPQLVYRVKRLVQRHTNNAEEVIKSQTREVGELSHLLVIYSDSIDSKLRFLDQRYDQIQLELLSRHDSISHLGQELDGKRPLLKQTQEAAETSSDPRKKIEYRNAHRKLRRMMEIEMHNLNLNNQAISLLTNELPLLDQVSAVAQAYSFVLKEIAQETDIMRQHLDSVLSLYVDMMRTQTVNGYLKSSVQDLFNFTRNMGRALEDGVREVVGRAENRQLVEREYLQGLSVGSAVDKVEDATFSGIRDLETRLTRYNTQM